jgi:hypothetical protein
MYLDANTHLLSTCRYTKGYLCALVLSPKRIGVISGPARWRIGPLNFYRFDFLVSYLKLLPCHVRNRARSQVEINEPGFNPSLF